MNTETKIGEQLFNHACSQAAQAYCPAYLDDCMMGGYDPFNNTEQLIWIFDLVVNYTDMPVHIEGGSENDDYMRKYVHGNIHILLEDDNKEQFSEAEEEQFNKMCSTLVKGFNIVDCQPTNEDFDPYNNIRDLAPIVPLIIKRTAEVFTIPGIMSDLSPSTESYNCDIHDNMRHYVQRHGQTLLDILGEIIK